MPACNFLLTSLLATLALLSSAARADTLPPPLEASLARSNIPHNAVAVVVQKVDGDAPLVSHRSGLHALARQVVTLVPISA